MSVIIEWGYIENYKRKYIASDIKYTFPVFEDNQILVYSKGIILNTIAIHGEIVFIFVVFFFTAFI